MLITAFGDVVNFWSVDLGLTQDVIWSVRQMRFTVDLSGISGNARISLCKPSQTCPQMGTESRGTNSG